MKSRITKTSLALLVLLTPSAYSAEVTVDQDALVSPWTSAWDEAQLNFSFNRKNVSLSRDQVWQADIAGIVNITKNFQLGLNLPISHRTIEQANESITRVGLDDLKLRVAYELLQDYDYTIWTPQTMVYTSIGIPTGHGIYEDQSDQTLTSASVPLNNGRWSTTAGIYAVKRLDVFDLYTDLNVTHSFSETYRSSLGEFQSGAQWKGQGVLGVNYLPEGTAIQIGAESGPTIYGSQEHRTSALRRTIESPVTWTLGATLGYSVSKTFSVAARFQDDAFLSISDTQAHERTFSLKLNYRFIH